MKIYTKTGDKGETSLVSGTRVEKSHERIKLYGELDELNSWLGCLLSHIPSTKDFKSTHELVELIQNNLFNLGALLACEPENRSKYKLPKLKEDLVLKMELSIDKMTEELVVLKEFILPGGSAAASFAHIARTESRKVERQYVEFTRQEPKESIVGALELLNRMSDYFFILARYCNFKLGFPDIAWKK